MPASTSALKRRHGPPSITRCSTTAMDAFNTALQGELSTDDLHPATLLHNVLPDLQQQACAEIIAVQSKPGSDSVTLQANQLGSILLWLCDNQFNLHVSLNGTIPYLTWARIIAEHLLMPANKLALVSNYIASNASARNKVPLDQVEIPLYHLYWIIQLNKKALQKGSHENSMQLVENAFLDIFDGYQTSFQLAALVKFATWLTSFPDKHCLNAWSVTPSPGPSSGIPKKVSKKDTRTSTTPAPSQNPPANASGSTKDSTLLDGETPPASEDDDTDSNDDLDEEYFTAKPLQKTTGLTGCNISVHRQGKSYNWRSEKFPMWRKHIDIKVYDDLKALKKAPDSLAAWKCATYRAKLTVGNPVTVPQTRRVLRALKELQEAILENAKLFPGVKESASDLPHTK